MRLYISGPMTGLPDHNFPAFNYNATRLRTAGYQVCNPADTGLIPGWSWADYIHYDIATLAICDGIALLPGWDESHGACLEVCYGYGTDLTIDTVNSWIAQTR